MSKDKTIALSMPSEVLEQIDELVTEAGVETRADLIRNGLRLYSWVLEKTKDGYDILARKDDHEIQVVLDEKGRI